MVEDSPFKSTKYERKSMEIDLENLYVDQLGLVNAGNNSWCPLPGIHLQSWCSKNVVF